MSTNDADMLGLDPGNRQFSKTKPTTEVPTDQAVEDLNPVTFSELLIDDTPEPDEPAPMAVAQTEPVDVTARKPQHVIQAFDIHSSVKQTEGEEYVFPSNFDAETRALLEKTPNINLLDSPESRQWASDLQEGLELTTLNEMFVPALEEEDAEFKHREEHNGVNLTAQAPRFKAIENQTLSGERAVIRILSHLGIGSLFQVPLWHSGIWVTFKPPHDSEIIELNRLLISDKIKFGRYSYGMSYSNTSSYTTDRLVDFALAHLYDTNIKAEDINATNIKQYVKCQDIPSLLWGFICTMYPRGFKYRRACVNDPEKCTYVLKETLNVWKLQWTNFKTLTDWQKTYMSSRQSKTKDLESLKRYGEEMGKLQNRRVVINEGQYNEIVFILRTPSIEEHVDAGHRWISEIVESVNAAVGMDTSDNDRNMYVTRHGQASAMRQYAHWVDSIEYGGILINDRETIETTLSAISSDDEIRVEMVNEVVKYINHSTLSVIGIPVYDCPACNQPQDSHIELPHHTNIIPIDVMQLFFDLLTQKLNRLTQR